MDNSTQPTSVYPIRVGQQVIHLPSPTAYAIGMVVATTRETVTLSLVNDGSRHTAPRHECFVVRIGPRHNFDPTRKTTCRA
jgi:hypothetical protein